MEGLWAAERGFEVPLVCGVLGNDSNSDVFVGGRLENGPEKAFDCTVVKVDKTTGNEICRTEADCNSRRAAHSDGRGASPAARSAHLVATPECCTPRASAGRNGSAGRAVPPPLCCESEQQPVCYPQRTD